MKIKIFSIPKYIRTIIYSFLIVIILLYTALTAGFYWFSTYNGQNYLQKVISEEISPIIGYKIKAEGIKFSFPLNTKISSFSLADEKGEWISANNIYFEILMMPNIINHLIVSHFSADNIFLHRIPSLIEDKNSENKKDIMVSIRDININKVIIAPKVTNYSRYIKAAIKGNIKWSGLKNSLYFDNFINLNNLMPNIKSNKITLSGQYLFEEKKLDTIFKKILNDEIEIDGKMNINFKSRDINIDANLDKLDLAKLSSKIKGKGEIKLKIIGTIENPEIKIDSEFNNFFYYQNEIPKVNIAVNSFVSNKILSGNVAINCGKLGSGNWKYEFHKNIIKLNDIKFNSFANYFGGDINVNIDTWLLNGVLKAQIKSFEEYNSLNLKSLSGEINILADFYNNYGNQGLNVDLKLIKLSVKDLYISEANAAVKINNINNYEFKSIKANISKILYQDINLNDVKINAFSSKKMLNLNYIINASHNDKEIKLDSNAIFNIDDLINKKETKIIFNRFKGTYNKHKFLNIGDIILCSSLNNKSLIIPKIKIADGDFSFNAILNDSSVAISSFVSNIPLKLFNDNLSVQMSDRLLRSKLVVTGEKINPEMSLNINIYGDDSSSLQNKKFNNNTIINIKDGKAKFTMNSLKNSTLYYNLIGEVPVYFNFNSSPILKIKKDEDIKANFKYELSKLIILNSLLPNEHEFSGNLSGRILISGKYDTPIINGKIKYKEGEYNYFPVYLKLNNINGDFSIKNNRLSIDKLVSEDADKHQLIIDGNIDFSNRKNYIYNLKINTKKFSLSSNPSINGIFSSNIILKGDSSFGEINGDINSEKIDIYLPNSFSSDAPKLNVYKVINNDSKLKKKTLNTFYYPLYLNLKLNAKNKIFIRGWGLDAELRGNLKIKGNIYKPNYSGKFSLIRGRYKEFGKNFKLKQADLLFEGNVPPSPYLNIIGSIYESNVEIMPVISGSLFNPALNIKSIPEHSQEDALSLLLFGAESSEITSFQAIQLANSLKRLTTKNDSGPDPLRKIRDLFGIDDINIKTDDSTSLSVEVQKYVVDNVKLKAGGGESDSTVAIEVDLTPNISVESGASTTSGNSVGVNWKYNY